MSLKFIEPCILTTAKALPIGPGWLFEPKIDGWRIQIVMDAGRVALYTRNGHDIAQRLPRLTDALRELPIRSCHIDGELIADYEDRIGNLWSLQRAMAEGREEQVAVMAFDLLSIDGSDLRRLHLVDRKLRLDQLVACAGLPCISYVHYHVDGAALFALIEELRLEGVIAKRVQAPYRSGRRKEWVKVKCQSWLEANRERWRAFARSDANRVASSKSLGLPGS